jgi:hypothetical protein
MPILNISKPDYLNVWETLAIVFFLPPFVCLLFVVLAVFNSDFQSAFPFWILYPVIYGTFFFIAAFVLALVALIRIRKSPMWPSGKFTCVFISILSPIAAIVFLFLSFLIRA